MRDKAQHITGKWRRGAIVSAFWISAHRDAATVLPEVVDAEFC